MATTLKVQAEIIDELEKNSVRFIVLTPGFWDEPNQSRMSSGVKELDLYIRRNFRLEEVLGDYEIWRK